MRAQPINRISKKGLKVWRLYGMIQTAVRLAISDWCRSINIHI